MAAAPECPLPGDAAKSRRAGPAGRVPVDQRPRLRTPDPAARHATTQFYTAYSFYREGWGRVYNDDVLFREALRALDRAVAAASGQVRVDDPTLGLRSSDELRAELERGLTRELSDFNPMRVLRPRQ